MPLLRGAADVRLAGLIVSVDRMERGSSPDRTALEAVGEEFSMPTASIVDLDAIVARLRPGGGAPSALTAAELERIAAYRAEWGVRRSSDATAP